MVFLSGPRQAGKAILSQKISKTFPNHLYLNWDIADHRSRILQNPTFFEAVERIDASAPLIILDEIHKYKNWKNDLKGIYDQFHREFLFLVTGSGRLDLYQKGGDSLAGRYFLFHLWPFTISELTEKRYSFESFLLNTLQISMENSVETKEIWSNLSEMSCFPEPFLSGKKTYYRRWSNTYSQQLQNPEPGRCFHFIVLKPSGKALKDQNHYGIRCLTWVHYLPPGCGIARLTPLPDWKNHFSLLT
jgi:predicted AAA+ superfamily ATPase